MSTYYTEVSTSATSYDTVAARFASRARTERGIIAAARKALAAKGYEGEVTPRDVAAVVNGKLVYIDTYQRMGLYK